jgi:hypothetical protein
MAPKPSDPPSPKTLPKSPQTSPPASPSQLPRRLSSPPPSPTKPSRASSIASTRKDQYFAPLTPSNLRRSTIVESPVSSNPDEQFFSPLNRPTGKDREMSRDDSSQQRGQPEGASKKTPAFNFEDVPESDENTRLLSVDSTAGHGNHGTFQSRRVMVRPGLHRNYDSFTSLMTDAGFGGSYPGEAESERGGESSSLLTDSLPDALHGETTNKMTTTQWLKKKYGIRGKRKM